MSTHFLVTIVDCKEYFEYTPGILRAYVKPKHFDALSFNLHPVIEEKMGCKFIWGEVLNLNGGDVMTAEIKPMFQENTEIIDFDYCVIASGCNFGPFQKLGESLWFPTVHIKEQEISQWKQFDERFIEGRRRHLLQEYANITALKENNAKILVTGAGFIGVEWVTELEHFFKGLDLTILDFLPNPLGPLPPGAAAYCKKYMARVGIHQYYEKSKKNEWDYNDPAMQQKAKDDPGFFKQRWKNKEEEDNFWQSIGFENGRRPDKEYVCIGVKASNYFLEKSAPNTLSEKGPGGGGWILMDKTLAVITRDGKRWCEDNKGFARIYAVGDCNYSCVEQPGKPPSDWPIPPIPKISYPGEEEAVIASRNIEKTDHMIFHSRTHDCCGGKLEISEMHWPWGAGMFATSLGPHDACFVAGANYEKGSGFTVLWGSLSAVQKEIIEHSKVDECAFGFLGRCIWHFVHHTPVHLWGGGPRWGY